MVGVEIGEQSGDVHTVRRHRADRDGSPDQLREVVDRKLDVRDGGKRSPRVRQHGFASRRQPHSAARPVQQCLAEFALQSLDLRADRRLRDVDPLGRPGEVRLFGDGDEVLELPKLHKQ